MTINTNIIVNQFRCILTKNLNNETTSTVNDVMTEYDKIIQLVIARIVSNGKKMTTLKKVIDDAIIGSFDFMMLRKVILHSYRNVFGSVGFSNSDTSLSDGMISAVFSDLSKLSKSNNITPSKISHAINFLGNYLNDVSILNSTSITNEEKLKQMLDDKVINFFEKMKDLIQNK